MKDEIVTGTSSFRLHPSAFTTGAGDEIRTRDPQLGRLMLYQLSYTRPFQCRLSISNCQFTKTNQPQLFNRQSRLVGIGNRQFRLVQGVGFEPT